MLSIYQLKPAFQNILRPGVTRLFGWGVSANQITLLALAGSILTSGLIAFFAEHTWVFAFLPAWMLARMSLNAVDGMLAREFAQKSDLGAYLNEICDIVADAFLILAFLFVPGTNPILILLALLLALVSEYAGVMGPMVGATRRYDGPMGKSDRALAFSLLAICIATDWLSGGWINLLMMGLCILQVLTLINRVRGGLAEVRVTTTSYQECTNVR